MNIMALLVAIIGAIVYAAGGYLKNSNDESFDEEKFVVTVIIGIVVGLLSFYVGASFDTATQMLTSTGIIVLIETYGKGLYRKIKKWLDNRA